jgi:hypothetical protein
MTLRLRSGVSMAPTDHGLVLLDGSTGRYWQLNTTAAQILQALIDGTDTDTLTTQLSATYQITREKAATDVTALLTHLHTARLVQEPTP